MLEWFLYPQELAKKVAANEKRKRKSRKITQKNIIQSRRLSMKEITSLEAFYNGRWVGTLAEMPCRYGWRSPAGSKARKIAEHIREIVRAELGDILDSRQ